MHAVSFQSKSNLFSKDFEMSVFWGTCFDIETAVCLKHEFAGFIISIEPRVKSSYNVSTYLT